MDEARRIADGMRAGRASRDDRMVRAFEAELIETCPDARLIRQDGMKNGETRRGPFSCRVSDVSAMPGRPPMPEPIITPVRSSFSSSVGFQPAIRNRLRPRPIAKMMKSSILRWSLGGDPIVGVELPRPSPRGT